MQDQDVHKAEIVYIEDNESLTDIPPMTRNLTYTLATNREHKTDLVDSVAVSKSKAKVCTKNEPEETNARLSKEKEKVIERYFPVNQSFHFIFFEKKVLKSFLI